MNKTRAIKAAMAVYDLAWSLAIPALRFNKRIADGFGQRTLKDGLPPKADLWIHAASSGESYLAGEIVNALKPAFPVDAVVTTNTRQGMEIAQGISKSRQHAEHLNVSVSLSPFDKPGILEKVAAARQPKAMVLLETELWPGLLWTLKKRGCPVLAVNARMNQKSLGRYLLWPSFWRAARPDRILAVSKPDAERFAKLFGDDVVERMPNIKFDRIGFGERADAGNPLERIIPSGTPFVVLGSTLRVEEPMVENMVAYIRANLPDAVIGLFPKHMRRIPNWRDRLKQSGTAYVLRSEAAGRVSPGTIVLWDVFGELAMAYESASSAFVGGSLVPRGGQNFLEPLMAGVRPVIGPHWSDFTWIGESIVSQGLIHIADDWGTAARLLVKHANQPADRENIRQKTLDYVKDRRGGTRQACRLIEAYLEGGTKN